MKRIIGVVISLLTITSMHAASIADLKGSYAELPEALRELSLLDGAIALETNMLKRIYQFDTISPVKKESIQLVKDLFYIIPETGEFGLSKKINPDDLMNKLITNMLIRWLMQSIHHGSENKKQQNPAIPELAKQLIQIGNAVPERFKSAQYDFAMATIKGALWYIKKNVNNFSYPEELKNAWRVLYENLLKSPNIKENSQIKEMLGNINTAIEGLSTNPTEELNNELETTTYTTEELDPNKYETLVVTLLQNLTGKETHPEKLEQIWNAQVTINGTTYAFADCVETLMRNLINILAYDLKSQALSTAKLTKKFPNAKEVIVNFYTKYPTIKDQKNPEAYNAWAQLVSDIQGVKYNPPKGESNKTYDLEPSYPNLIMLTNYLLGLDWFEQPATYPEDPETFTKEHINQFVALFGTAKDTELKNLEEYGDLTITNQDETVTFTIKTTSSHGYMQYTTQQTSIPSISIKNYQAYPQLYNITQVTKWLNTPEHIIHLFAQPIDEADFSSRLPEILATIPYTWMLFVENLLGKHPDQDVARKAIINLYKKLIKNIAQYNEMEKKNITRNAIRAAKTATTDQNKDIRNAALNLWKKLFNKGQGFSEAIETAKLGTTDQNKDIRDAALHLWKELFSRGQGFTEAIETATTAIANPDYNVRITALRLRLLLFYQGQGFDGAIETAKTGINKTNLNSHDNDLDLWRNFFRSGQGFTEAIQFAKIGIKDTNWMVRNNALKLFIELVKKDQGFPEAIDAAKTRITDTDRTIRNNALELFKELIKKDQAIKEAIEFAKKGITDQDWMVSNNTLKMWGVLFNNSQGLNAAIEFAKKGINETDLNIRIKALELLKELIKKGQGFTETIEAAKIAITDQDETIRNKALKLFIELVKKDQGFPEAIDAAKKGIADTDWMAKASALNLFKELFKKGQGFPEAIEFAKTRITDTDWRVSNNALELFKELIKKDQGFPEAIEFATKGITDADSNIRITANKLQDLLGKKEHQNRYTNNEVTL